MEESRAARLTRLVRLQRQLERMAENDLLHVTRERARLDERREATITALATFSPLHQAMASTYSDGFRGLDARSQRLEAMQKMQEKRLLIERTKADRLDETAGEAREAEARGAEDEALLDLLDMVLPQGRRSSPA
ncbi:hypothetical protein [Pseudohoeflea coraliihabitans]|uniref:Flagellar FliJ protein n=1 Tax=Pseudohoeflea coraliihabitans TaxID=2860393 RepID=A0ABS6WN84_9HYPH|nr:hypothetical protein [Pseudohoeflea sp. DP4N28-3]MBW3097345.1 hypothetical protein [Pseudohoeflea sp. DP4N28-3]